jgi:hypothetical protein
MGTVLIRSALIAIALLAGAWLVLSFRSLELESKGQAVATKAQRGPITADELSRGRSLLHRARRFSVDQGPRIVEALLLDSARRPEQAVAVAERVVDDEPDNVYAWIVQYLALRDLKGAASDPRRAARALRMARSLNPLAGEVLRPPR